MSPRKPATLKLEHILIALLDQKPMHGYEMYQHLSEIKGISRLWNIKQPMLYAILDKLESRDLVTSQLVSGETYPPRKCFHPTESGIESLKNWLKTPVHRARDVRQEFLAKLIVAGWYGKADVLTLIQIQEEECRNWFHETPVNLLSSDRGNLDEWFVYTYRMNQIKGIIDWLKACEKELGSIENFN